MMGLPTTGMRATQTNKISRSEFEQWLVLKKVVKENVDLPSSSGRLLTTLNNWLVWINSMKEEMSTGDLVAMNRTQRAIASL